MNEGQRVLHYRLGVGTVASGILYLVDFNGNLEYVEASQLKPASHFQVGEEVTVYLRKNIVKSGVYEDDDGTRAYVVFDTEMGEYHMADENDIQR